MKNLKSALIVPALLVMTSPAFAQLSKGTTMLNSVQTWLQGIAVVVVTLALMFVGFRMVFNAAQWKDVAPVFWGGVVIGGAAGKGRTFCCDRVITERRLLGRAS